MTADAVWGVIRTILAALGGYGVAKGWVDDATLTSVLSALGVLFVAVWSVIQKLAAANKPTA